MYKDKDKQREAQRERIRRYRAKQKGVTQPEALQAKGVTSEGVTQGVTDGQFQQMPDDSLVGDGYVKQVANTGGEVSYKTTNDVVSDVHITLPACVPDVIRNRYARGEPDYTAVIDKLCAHTLDELKAMAVWIPCWRYEAGQRLTEVV